MRVKNAAFRVSRLPALKLSVMQGTLVDRRGLRVCCELLGWCRVLAAMVCDSFVRTFLVCAFAGQFSRSRKRRLLLLMLGPRLMWGSVAHCCQGLSSASGRPSVQMRVKNAAFRVSRVAFETFLPALKLSVMQGTLVDRRGLRVCCELLGLCRVLAVMVCDSFVRTFLVTRVCGSVFQELGKKLMLMLGP